MTTESKTRKISALALAAFGVLALQACDDGEPAPKPVPTSTAPVIEPAPLIVGLQLSMADEKGVTIDAIDFGPHIVDGETHHRGIIDRTGWRVVAQCDDMKNGRVKAGAVKVNEHEIIVAGGQGAMIAENTLQGLLECPK